jgi:hypothetical protein
MLHAIFHRKQRIYLANFTQELRVGEFSILIRLIPLPIHGNLLTISGLHISVHGIVAHVGFAPFKPLSDTNNDQ